ncbi:MAG: right-handed parallel beta-helix repeat-containing protein, partial [Bryobacteraceae bacterium]
FVHDNVGGRDWANRADGINLGHTGGSGVTFRNARIRENEISRNGNPAQNQTGRGVTASAGGSLFLERNYIHDNAAAGVYLGETGRHLDIAFIANQFWNNHLRGFGWQSAGDVTARENIVVANDAGLRTATIGVEFSGAGRAELRGNHFRLLFPEARFGAFVYRHDHSTPARFSGNIYCNLSIGDSGRRFLDGDFRNPADYRDFKEWNRQEGAEGDRYNPGECAEEIYPPTVFRKGQPSGKLI